jgi:hypothetical protein
MAIRISGNAVIPDIVGCNTTSGNTVLGINNLGALTTGARNVSVGMCNQPATTVGTDNISVGYCALYNNTAGLSNIAVGCRAGADVTTGCNNTIIGSLTGSAGLTCTVLVGAGACERIKVNDTGLYVNGSLFSGGGVSSLNSLTGAVTLSAGTNITIGTSGNTLTFCSSGGGGGGSSTLDAYCSIAIGGGLGTNTGYNNIAIGYCALNVNTTGDNNFAIGYCALGNNTTGDNNVAIGFCSLYNSNATGNNIAIGFCSGAALTTGINNTIIGSLAGTAGTVCTVLIGAGTCQRVRVDDTGLYVNGATDPAIGYLGVPINSQSAAYPIVASDAGKTILHPSTDNDARTFTIPANSSVAFPVGTTITFINMINTVTITITTDTLYLAGTGTTGSRTLAAFGMATAVKIDSTSWIISGSGLS